MKILSHLAGYLPVNIASAIASFGGVYVFTRLMTGEDYGVYALMFSVMTIIHTLSLTWVEAANYRFSATAQEEGKLPDHFRMAIRLMVRSFLAAFLLIGLSWIFLHDQPKMVRILILFFALLPLMTVVRVALEAHRAAQRVGRYAFVETTRLLSAFAIGALVCWQTDLGASGPFIGFLAAATALAIFEGPWIVKAARGGTISPTVQRQWLAYGIPIAAALVLDILLSAADRFLIWYFIDEAAVGAYAAGYGVADKTVLLICAWAAMAASPLMMAAYEKGGAGAAADEARNLVNTLFLIGLPAAAGIALVADPLADAMIGEELREQAKEIIPWIAFAGLMNGLLIHYFCETFQLVKKTHERALLMLVPAIVNIIANIILLPRMNVMGAVYATVGSYLLGNIVLGLYGRRYIKLPLPIIDIAKVSIACLAMWPIIRLVPDMAAWPELFIKAAAGGSVYVMVAFALNAGGARDFARKTLSRA